jgi:hypothetical protein
MYFKIKLLFQKPKGRYVNKTMMDDYIDEYWIFNCPDNYSVTKINEQIYSLFHQLFIANTNETCKN